MTSSFVKILEKEDLSCWIRMASLSTFCQKAPVYLARLRFPL